MSNSGSKTDWLEIGLALGTIKIGGESGGTGYAKKALEMILGKEWIIDTVEYAISFRPGSELAMNCLNHINSVKAVEYAYQIYKSSTGERARNAVWLIKHIPNKVSFNWVNEFLEDPNVVNWGLGVLDQLLWCEEIEYSEEVERLFAKASQNSNGALDELIDFIRGYLKNRDKIDNNE